VQVTSQLLGGSAEEQGRVAGALYEMMRPYEVVAR
jgi:hypothetical protein